MSPSPALADVSAVVETYLQGVADAVRSLSRDEISGAIAILEAACRTGRRVYVFGNGGSAATASHMVCDLSKQALVSGAPAMRVHALNDNVPLLTAWSNDEDYSAAFTRQLDNLVESEDVVVAISTSGNSPNVLRAVRCARERGAHVIGMTGQDGGMLAGLADCCLHAPCDDIGQQEDVHLVINHVLAMGLRARLAAS